MDVVVVIVTEGDELGGTVIVEEVVTTGAEVESLETVAEEVESPLSLLVGAKVPEPVAESVAELLEPESPVDRATL